MLIGLNGRLKSGKDTTFQMIQEVLAERNITGEVDPERVSFADPLKDSASAALGMTRELMEALKNDESIHISVTGTSSIGHLLASDLAGEATKWKMNMREYLQRYGTEAHRDIFGTDFWVDMALPIDMDHSKSLIVVTDMRFPNEIQRVKDLGGMCVKVVRETETAHSTHASEQDVDHLIDYFLDNTGDLGQLKTNVSEMLSAFAIATPEMVGPEGYKNIQNLMTVKEKV